MPPTFTPKTPPLTALQPENTITQTAANAAAKEKYRLFLHEFTKPPRTDIYRKYNRIPAVCQMF